MPTGGDSGGASKEGELTIASLNIRNLGTRSRTLKDYEALVDLVDEADVVLFQEVGLGLYDGDPGLCEAWDWFLVRTRPRAAALRHRSAPAMLVLGIAHQAHRGVPEPPVALWN